MEDVTQNAIRALLRALTAAGTISKETVEDFSRELRSEAGKAFEGNYEVEGRQLQNLAIAVSSDTKAP